MATLHKSLTSRPRRNSPDHNAKGTQSGARALRHAALLPLVGQWFQALFHSPHRGAFHLSLTVLVHYRSHGSLSPWRVVPPASRPVPRAGRYSGTLLAEVLRVPLPGCHRLGRAVPGHFASLLLDRPQVLQPRLDKPAGLGVAPFRSPLLRGSRLIPLPPGTEMFQFPGFAPQLAVTGVPAGRVSPFGHPGLIARVQLPPAYRGLPRPSSPPCAQASPTGLLSLDLSCRQAPYAQPERPSAPRPTTLRNLSGTSLSARAGRIRFPLADSPSQGRQPPPSSLTCQIASGLPAGRPAPLCLLVPRRASKVPRERPHFRADGVAASARPRRSAPRTGVKRTE